jgi:hypothetical protein
MADNDLFVPDTKPKKVLKIGQFEIDFTRRRSRIAISLVGLVVLWTPGSYFLSEFDQTRGLMGLAYSRVWLGCVCVVIALSFLLVLSQLIGRNWSAILSVMAGVGAFFLIDWYAPKPPIPTPVSLPIIQTACTLKPLGISILPGTEASIITLQDSFLAEMQIYKAGGKVVDWPTGLAAAVERHDPGNFMYECSIFDVSSIGAFNLTLPVRFDFLSEEQPPKPTHTVVLNVFVNSITTEKPFSYFVVNKSRWFTSVTPSDTVTLQAQGTVAKVSVPIDHTGDTVDKRINQIVGLPPTFSKWTGDTISGRGTYPPVTSKKP